MPYITVGLTEQARDTLRSLAIALTSPLGRKPTMSQVLLALAEVGQRHRDELLEALRDHDGVQDGS